MNFSRKMLSALLGLAALALPAAAPRLALHDGLHPLHVSLAEGERNAQTGALEVAVKIFADDLEADLLREAGRTAPLHLATPREAHGAEALLEAYALRHFALFGADGQPVAVRYVGRETAQAGDAALWLYLESAPLAQAPRRLEVRYTALLGLYADQVNLVNLRLHGRVRSARLVRGQERQALEWD